MAHITAYTKEEERILRKLYPVATKAEILKALPGRNWVGIQRVASSRGIRRPNFSTKREPNTIVWRMCEKGYKLPWMYFGVGKWKRLNHFNWEQVHGAVPKGYVLCYKDLTLAGLEKEEVGNLHIITIAQHARNAGVFNTQEVRIQAGKSVKITMAKRKIQPKPLPKAIEDKVFVKLTPKFGVWVKKGTSVDELKVKFAKQLEY